mmetsp:Transcript_29411/g.63935  ORF Transcript_29411/g.63935 Transcript_29411/m.63935 type:complete len:201 (-) Transcript_29411:752-1354(-)
MPIITARRRPEGRKETLEGQYEAPLSGRWATVEGCGLSWPGTRRRCWINGIGMPLSAARSHASSSSNAASSTRSAAEPATFTMASMTWPAGPSLHLGSFSQSGFSNSNTFAQARHSPQLPVTKPFVESIFGFCPAQRFHQGPPPLGTVIVMKPFFRTHSGGTSWSSSECLSSHSTARFTSPPQRCKASRIWVMLASGMIS